MYGISPPQGSAKTGTGVTEVAIDLAGVPGSGVGDGQADTVTLNATAASDTISITNSANATVFVNGLPADVTIDGADPSLDTLVVNGLGGNDTIDASFLSANWIKLTIDGGAGNDTIIGSQGSENAGTAINNSHSNIKSPRDAASGQASGKVNVQDLNVMKRTESPAPADPKK